MNLSRASYMYIHISDYKRRGDVLSLHRVKNVSIKLQHCFLYLLRGL